MSASRPLRIAVGGIGHEANTFSALPTRLDDFRVARGDALLPGLGLDPGPGVELVPTLHAWAMPGGLVDGDAYVRLRDELVARLRAAGRLDGVYLALHGAMEADAVEGVEKAEADLLAAVRDVVGPATPVAASLDLHANLTPAIADLADVLTAYRTAPHRDAQPTRQRALSLLLRSIREGLRPTTALVKPPLLLPGEKAVTDVEPMASLLRLAAAAAQAPGMLDASLLVGCAWTDVPHATAGAVAVAAGDRAAALAQASRLAAALWAARASFAYDVEALPLDACIDAALAAPEPTVFISDSGDNPTAGAPGDVPVVLARLLARRVPDAVVAAIADAAAVARCRAAGVGARVALALGGKLDATTAPPLPVEGQVEFLAPAGPGPADLAVLRVGGVAAILTASRRAFISPEHFQEADIEPLAHRIVVVKQGYLFAELRRIAPRALLALSPGQSDLVLERLPYRRLARGVYPLEPGLAWQP